MIRQPEGSVITGLLGWVACLTTLIVTPSLSYDPINPPKLAVVCAGGFMALFLLGSQLTLVRDRRIFLPMLILVLFDLDLVLVLIFTGHNFNQEFFGTSGRSTGFLAYVALSGLFLVSMISSTKLRLWRISYFLIATGLISTIYGALQAWGGDPIGWVNSYSPVIGFLGNPDFQSSFLALSAIMSFALLMGRDIGTKFKLANVPYLLLTLYVIRETNAQQGYFIFFGGLAFVSLILILKSKFRILILPMLIVGSSTLALAIMGALNSGPLAQYLHKASVTYRGDYWHAGWNMTITHPLFGVGLDSYGDWYRRSRTTAATLRRGPDIISNSAHNVLLDFSSNGGFPLVTLYLILMAFVIRAAFIVIRRSREFDSVFTGLVAVWIAYQAQSIISINQLGLAIWGWIISGLIIGYEINGRGNKEVIGPKIHTKNVKAKLVNQNQSILPRSLISLSAGLLIGLLFGLPPLIASTKFTSSLESSDKTSIENAAYVFPQDELRMVQVGYIFYKEK